MLRLIRIIAAWAALGLRDVVDPRIDSFIVSGFYRRSRRERIAAQLLAGHLAGEDGFASITKPETIRREIDTALAYADALILALDEPPAKEVPRAPVA